MDEDGARGGAALSCPAMRAFLHAAAPALLCACAVPAVPADSAPRPVSVEEEDERLRFAFAWPAEAAALPALDARLRERMAAARAEARENVEADAAAAAESGYPFNPHHLSESWEVAGDSGPLLALAATIESYSGGAHGNLGFDGILWDREAGGEIATAALFDGGLDPLRDRFCAALNAERAERRGEPVRATGDDDFMTGCPSFDEIVVLPADANKDGRLDSLLFLVAPYIAGPWAEGPYPIELDLAAREAERILPRYRPAFER